MAYRYIVDHIPETINGIKNRKRPALPMDWETITVHNTGNPRSTARDERNWLTNSLNANNSTGYHLVVDESEVIECIPTWENAYHAGDGANGKGNTTSVGLEICEVGNFEKTLANAAYLIASMLHSKDKSIKHVDQHNKWNGSNCPRLLRIGDRWSKFMADIDIQLTLLKSPAKNDVSKNTSHWKYEGIDELARMGLLNTPEEWKKKIDEPLPVWAGMLILSRIARESIK